MVQRSRPADARPGPVRTCVGCRVKALNTELLRLVIVDGQIVPDPRRGRPGRGAWLHPDPDCLRAAERRRAFGRAFRTPSPLDVDPVRALLDAPLGASGDTGPSRVRKDQGSRSTRHESAVKLKP